MNDEQGQTEQILSIVRGLGPLNDRMVFVGGAISWTYGDDPAALDFRPTQDIDLSLLIAGLGDWQALQEQLREQGFHPDSQSTVICRYRYKGIAVDIMPDQASILGFSNPWFAPGIAVKEWYLLRGEVLYRMPFLYFLASKIAALRSRGTDWRWSKDMEDIVWLFNNRQQVSTDWYQAEERLKDYLAGWAGEVLAKESLEELLESHLPPYERSRCPFLIERLRALAAAN